MAKLPRDASARKVIKAFEKMGFRVVSVSGSHYKMVHRDDSKRLVVVPFHGRLKTGTLRSILKAARITVEEFLEAFIVL